MNRAGMHTEESARDVTTDFLLCNRCGACRYVCPLLSVYREEWAGARGKVELAEAFFRGEKIESRELQKIFDLCLHCMACEENCPSGMRADEIVMAARAEMARRGMMPRVKRVALRLLEGADTGLFRVMRLLRLVRRAPLHGVGGKSPLAVFYPLLGWPRERFLPLPAEKPFLASDQDLYRAVDVNVAWPDYSSLAAAVAGRPYDAAKAAELVRRVSAARERNLASRRRAYFFVGHAVNNFFPEEARAVVRLLNILGVDVLAPRDQLCCGAPVYYAGDIEGARESAMRVLERFEEKRYDWIVSTCSSGSLMLREEFPRLFDLNYDGYFEIAWDDEAETFRREPKANATRKKYPRAEDLYRAHVEGKVRDINELVAEFLELEPEGQRLKGLFAEPEEMHGIEESGARGGMQGRGRSDLIEEMRHDMAGEVRGEVGSAEQVPETNGARASEGKAPQPVSHGMEASGDGAPTAGEPAAPVVTYHHPCHLNRGQDIDWQPEAILSTLPGYRYVRMKDADRCCGGGGAFTFLNSDASAEIARVKMDAIEEVQPAVVATACPLCRIQLMDMIRRRFVLERKSKGKKRAPVPVTTPAELLLEELEGILKAT